jgi:hypothetical protein
MIITYRKKVLVYSGDIKDSIVCNGGGQLTVFNNTVSDMKVTYQLGNKTETAVIKTKDILSRGDFPDFCDQPDLRIISFEYL